MSLYRLINIVRDLIAVNRRVTPLARAMRPAHLEPRNAYGFPVMPSATALASSNKSRAIVSPINSTAGYGRLQ
jgi:hypothetical protein